MPRRSRCWCEVRCGEVGGVLLVSLVLMAGSAWTAWVWRANGYERRLAASDQAHYPGLAMRKPNKHTCVIALRLLTCGRCPTRRHQLQRLGLWRP